MPAVKTRICCQEIGSSKYVAVTYVCRGLWRYSGISRAKVAGRYLRLVRKLVLDACCFAALGQSLPISRSLGNRKLKWALKP